MPRLLLLPLLSLALFACNNPRRIGDAVPADSGALDAHAADGAPGDAAPTDAGSTDAGHDAGGTDAGAVDAGAHDGGSGPCAIVGDYAITFMGMTAYFRFAADGTWAGATDRAGLDTPTGYGTYTLTGSTLVLHETDTGASCMPTDVGTYTVTFDAGCGGLMLALVTDSCSARGSVLGAVHFTRQP